MASVIRDMADETSAPATPVSMPRPFSITQKAQRLLKTEKSSMLMKLICL